jgi:mannosyltransferase OCH1-like enzyme
MYSKDGFHIILWKDQDVRNILDSYELSVYNTLQNIQKSDMARYVILKKYGGIYADFDIDSIKSLNEIISSLSENKEGVLFIENIYRLNKQANMYKRFKIRNNTPEDKIRMANYLMIFKPQSNFLSQCIQLLLQRSHLPIECDYDILYTTGPDIISHIYARYPFSNNYLETISIQKSREYFIHKCSGHWRKE